MKIANPVSFGMGGAAAAILSLLVAGCGSGKTADPAPKTVFDHFAISVGTHTASLQIAVLPPEQQRGLMGRSDLGKDEGMLFVFAEPQKQSFWMRDTPEALDIGYLTSDGLIAEVYQLLPFDERSVSSHSDAIQFALEMPQGWFAAHGIRPGARVDLKAVAEALRARGFEPAKFKLK